MGETVQSVVAQAGGGFDVSFLLMMVAMFGIVYVLMIRPQRKQQAEHQALLGALKKGDEVVLSSGIIGKIFSVEDKIVSVDIGGGTRVRVLKNAVSGQASRMLGTPEKAKAALDEKKPTSETEGDAPSEAADEADGEEGDKNKKKGKKRSA